VCQRAERLTVFAWSFRYPGEPSGLTVPEVEEALATAHELYDAILARLPAEVHP